MKKKALISFALLLASAAGYSQGFYIRFGLGYAFPQAGQTLDGTGTPYNGTVNTPNSYLQTFDTKSASFSSGFQSTLGLGYMFTKHIGVQLDAVSGSANKKYSFTQPNVNYNGVQSDVTTTMQSQTFNLVPSLVLQTGGDPWNIYTRLGIALPLQSGITEDLVVANLPGTGAVTVDDFTFDVKNSFGLGIAAAAGVRYNINDRFSVWGEVSMLSMSLYIKKSDLSAFSENGISYSTSAISGPTHVKYSKNAVLDTNNNTAAAYSQPYSNFAVHFGIMYQLSRKNGHHNKRSSQDIDRAERPKNGSFKR